MAMTFIISIRIGVSIAEMVILVLQIHGSEEHKIWLAKSKNSRIISRHLRLSLATSMLLAALNADAVLQLRRAQIISFRMVFTLQRIITLTRSFTPGTGKLAAHM